MILMSAVRGLVQTQPVTTSYDPARKDVGVSSEERANPETVFRRSPFHLLQRDGTKDTSTPR
jgi:hypothetical protein